MIIWYITGLYTKLNGHKHSNSKVKEGTGTLFQADFLFSYSCWNLSKWKMQNSNQKTFTMASEVYKTWHILPATGEEKKVQMVRCSINKHKNMWNTQKLKGLRRRYGAQSSPMPSKKGCWQDRPLLGHQTSTTSGQKEELTSFAQHWTTESLNSPSPLIHLFLEF